VGTGRDELDRGFPSPARTDTVYRRLTGSLTASNTVVVDRTDHADQGAVGEPRSNSDSGKAKPWHGRRRHAAPAARSAVLHFAVRSRPRAASTRELTGLGPVESGQLVGRQHAGVRPGEDDAGMIVLRPADPVGRRAVVGQDILDVAPSPVPIDCRRLDKSVACCGLHVSLPSLFGQSGGSESVR
jgi:hypothetical protein